MTRRPSAFIGRTLIRFSCWGIRLQPPTIATGTLLSVPSERRTEIYERCVGESHCVGVLGHEISDKCAHDIISGVSRFAVFDKSSFPSSCGWHSQCKG